MYIGLTISISRYNCICYLLSVIRILAIFRIGAHQLASIGWQHRGTSMYNPQYMHLYSDSN